VACLTSRLHRAANAVAKKVLALGYSGINLPLLIDVAFFASRGKFFFFIRANDLRAQDILSSRMIFLLESISSCFLCFFMGHTP
jgi:hypothetical protein